MNIISLKLVTFSPTGTTRKIIEGIAQGINHSATEHIDITRQENRTRQLETSNNELLIIGVPVYFGRVQTHALDWLQTIKACQTPTVCVVVYGNREYDDALLELKDSVHQRGCLPIACAAFIGEHSFSNAEAPLAVGRPDADDLRLARSFGERIREKIAATSSSSLIAEITVPGNYPYVDMTESRERLSSLDFIEIDTSCVQCGECARLCPVGAIDPENGAAIDKDKCILCHACLKNCPSKARKIRHDLIRSTALWLSETFQVRKEPVTFL